ncbi:MAG: site-specific integrase [Methylococcaceae bacterium]
MANIKERLAKDGTKRFTCDIRLKGYPPQRATFKRLTDAKKWIQDTESAIREGRHFKTIEAKKHTLADLVDRYIKDVLPTKPKQQVVQKQQLEWWRDKLGVYVLAEITPALIVECRDELLAGQTIRNKQRTPATVVRYMAALSHAFTIAVNEWQWIDDTPMRKVKKPIEARGRVRFLDDIERAKLLAACKESPNKMLYVCVVMALSTGMRQSELMSLKWRDVDLNTGIATLHETKNGERRFVPITGYALELLRDYSKVIRIGTPLLFPSAIKPQQPIDLKKAWNNAIKKAGIEGFNWHDLRHTFASYLAMDGATHSELADAMGHKSLTMVKRYAHLSNEHLSNVVASMNQKIFGGVA